jgi:predicted DNA-binding transcriptional regulator AlpA
VTTSSSVANSSGTTTALSVGVQDAARITGLSVNWLNQMRSKGTGPRYVKIGRRALYLVADLESWLKGAAVERIAA